MMPQPINPSLSAVPPIRGNLDTAGDHIADMRESQWGLSHCGTNCPISSYPIQETACAAGGER